MGEQCTTFNRIVKGRNGGGGDREIRRQGETEVGRIKMTITIKIRNKIMMRENGDVACTCWFGNGLWISFCSGHTDPQDDVGNQTNPAKE